MKKIMLFFLITTSAVFGDASSLKLSFSDPGWNHFVDETLNRDGRWDSDMKRKLKSFHETVRMRFSMESILLSIGGEDEGPRYSYSYRIVAQKGDYYFCTRNKKEFKIELRSVGTSMYWITIHEESLSFLLKAR